MTSGVGNEIRNLIRALERQDQQRERIERRHKRRGVAQGPKHSGNEAPRRK